MQTPSNAEVISMELRTLWRTVEEACADNIVTEEEKARMRALAYPLIRRTWLQAVFQAIGLRLIRTASCGKNLFTELRTLCRDEEKAAVGWNPTTADEFELAA
jgi:hypothetical protein